MGAPRHLQRGFTIIELMVTIAILGIMATLAAPSFRDTILSARVRSSASDLFDSVLLARSEAVKRNAVVEVVPSASGWAGGWSVKRQSDGLVLQSREDNRIPMGSATEAFARIGSTDKTLQWSSGSGHVVTVDYGYEMIGTAAADWLETRLP